MPEPRKLNGPLRITACIDPDGVPSVGLQLPDGSGFIADRDSALKVAFAMISVARNLFTSVDELNAAVLSAQAAFPVLTAESAPPEKVQ